VATRTFLGEKVEYQVRVGTELIQVTDYRPSLTGPIQPGEAVSLDVPPEAVRVLPGAPA
jgi:iron(III) transport system ATP-binding protein